eukprot:5484224-Prymnesium_polylepis.1
MRAPSACHVPSARNTHTPSRSAAAPRTWRSAPRRSDTSRQCSGVPYPAGDGGVVRRTAGRLGRWSARAH